MKSIAAIAIAAAAVATVGAAALDLLDRPWLCEHDRDSLAQIAGRRDRELRFQFALAGGPPRAQFAALVSPITGGLTPFTRVTFTAHATRPMRINVDLRPAGTNNPPRWRRSIYLDESPRTVTVAFDDMRPLAGGAGAVPRAAIGALMFVVDTNNTKPGVSGTVTFTSVALGAD